VTLLGVAIAFLPGLHPMPDGRILMARLVGAGPRPHESKSRKSDLTAVHDRG
jgi:hypothetical protein